MLQNLKPADTHAHTWPASVTRVGFDLVQLSQVRQAVERFGTAYKERVFTRLELAYADAGGSTCIERLAARFAAKEAVLKVLRSPDVGIGWRQIEVRKCPDGSCRIELHGRAAELAREQGIGELLLSLSHDGDYAGAFVAAVPARGVEHRNRQSLPDAHEHS